MIAAGKLRDRITIEVREVTPHPEYATPVEGEWVEYITVRAEVQDFLPSKGDTVVEGVSLARRPCRIRIRRRRDITSAMRVKIKDRVLRIVTTPAEIDNGDMTEFVAEQWSTGGQEP